LQPLADHEISMNKIESRPAQGGKWAYLFFIDIDGHQQDDDVIKALNELKQQSSLFKILGSYPKASL
jgi:chorismate mutase/prephenate dehydratase